MEELPPGELPDQRNKRYEINALSFHPVIQWIRFRWDIAKIAGRFTFVVLTYIRSTNDRRRPISRIIIDDSCRRITTARFDRGLM